MPVAEAQNMFEFWDELWARVFARLQHFGLKVPDDGCCGVYSCGAGPGGDLDAGDDVEIRWGAVRTA